MPENADAGFVDSAKTWFHKANLNTAQAKAVTESYRAYELDLAQQVEKQHGDQVEALQKEWGEKFSTKLTTAKSAIKAVGFDDTHAKAIELAIGPAAAARMFEFFGRNYAEGSPPGNDQRGAPGFSSVTPAAAQQKMTQLRADPNFQARYRNTDPKIRAAAIEEMDMLAKVAVNASAT
jgi:3-oxoacyl-ACP reductase-like protein